LYDEKNCSAFRLRVFIIQGRPKVGIHHQYYTVYLLLAYLVFEGTLQLKVKVKVKV